MIELLDAIEAVARRLAMVAQRNDAARKHDLVAARRELAILTVTIMAEGEGYAPITSDPRRYAELRRRISELRGVIADHQATWSAVSIDSDDAAYRAASAHVQEHARGFMRWIRAEVEAMPDGDGTRRAHPAGRATGSV